MASILGEAFKFARGGLNRDNQADAGTSSRIAPKKKFFDFGAAIDATEFGQQHRMAEASIASTEASTRSSDAFAVSRTSQAEKNRQDILDKNEPIDLNKVLGVSFTPTRTKGIIDFMKINGADIDGNNIITPQEGSTFLSTLQKNHPNFIKEQLTGASKDAQTQMEDIQVTMFGTPEGKKLNAQFPDITTDNIEQAFQDRPILTQTFPKLGEQVRQLSALRQRKEGFGEMQKNFEVGVQGETGTVKSKEGFEATKTAEEISRAMTGKQFSDLSQGEQEKVIARKYKEDPIRVKAAMELRKEFSDLPEVKEFKTVRQTFSIMDDIIHRYQTEGVKSKVALDQALITEFNKLTDPQSVVRESEYARTPKNVSLINSIRGKVEKVIKGGAGLTDTEREELVATAKLMKNSYFKYYIDTAERYIELAEKTGLDPDLVVLIPEIAREKSLLEQSFDPAQYNGQIATDTETRKKYQSDGTQWKEIQ